MMGLGAILFSHQNRRCRKSAPNSNIMGANVDKKRRFRAEHPANLFRAGSASWGVSWRFCVSLMTARCCKSAPIRVPAGANPGRERTPRQIANLTTTMPTGRSLAPHHGGWRAALFPRHLRIMATNEHAWPPSGSHHGGLEGGLFSPEMRRLCRRPWLPSSSHHGG